LGFREITYFAILVRILSALIIGGIIGMERGSKNRPAGLRTYMLVCVGSCLIMLTNQYIYQCTGSGDPMRLGAQVVSGIGFLGAGTIVVTKHNQIKGLTTAAGLWASAGVGLALGIGFYEGAITATIGIYTILTILQRVDRRVHKRTRVIELYVELLKTVSLADFLQHVRDLEFKVDSIENEPSSAVENNSRALLMTLKTSKPEDHVVLSERIKSIPGVVHIEEL
jgi:putative Mg2+ transporter-C (MgtC) family protein